MHCASLFRASFPGLVNICYHLSNGLPTEKVNRLFHLVTVIVHGKAMLCTSNMLIYVILCILCHNKPTTVFAHTVLIWYTMSTMPYYTYHSMTQ